jgi:hypothetical protein
MRSLTAVVLLTACSSSHPASKPDATPIGGDAALPADSASDAPLAGSACPTQVTEVKRLVNALSQYPFDLAKVVVADFDHDGHDDIAVIEDEVLSSNTMTVRVTLFLQTAGGFATPIQSEMPFPYHDFDRIMIGDFNGDHLIDLLITDTEQQETPFQRWSYIYAATQQADHTFTMGSYIDSSACQSSDDERLFAVGVLDIDGDGADDVLETVSYDGLGAYPAGLSLLRGGASGLGHATCVRSATTTNAGYPLDLVTAQSFWTADFNGDGKLDLLKEDYDHPELLSVFYAAGASQFTEAGSPVSYDEYARLGFDRAAGGGISGLIAMSTTETMGTVNRYPINASGLAAGVSVATLNQGDGGSLYIPGFAVADFNRDGLTDVVVIGQPTNSDASAPVSFGMACDRTAQWQTSTGSFPNHVWLLSPIELAGQTDVVVQDLATTWDLVVYQLN